jgi:phage-related protein (TIGR01555 family)
LEKINKDTPLEFYVTDNWEISKTDLNATEFNNIDWNSDTPFQLRGHAIHKSRVILFKGKEFPPLYRPIGRGWGMSILEPLVRTLNKSIKNENVIFELLDEAKMDVFSLYGLNDAMQDEHATEAITKRVAYAEQVKNYMKAILMDSEDQYAQKQIHFSGLSDLKIDSRVDTASDARITMNKLYGTSPAGFNSGEADRETYADTVEAEIRIPSESAILKILEVVGRKVLEKTLDFDFEWASLIRTSEYEQEKRKTLMIANLNEANVWGRITNKEWQEAVNKYNLLGIDVSYKETFVADPMAKQVFKPGFGGK